MCWSVRRIESFAPELLWYVWSDCTCWDVAQYAEVVYDKGLQKKGGRGQAFIRWDVFFLLCFVDRFRVERRRHVYDLDTWQGVSDDIIFTCNILKNAQNWLIKSNWCNWRGEAFSGRCSNALTRGLWSVWMTNCRPSSMCSKNLSAANTARSSLSYGL